MDIELEVILMRPFRLAALAALALSPCLSAQADVPSAGYALAPLPYPGTSVTLTLASQDVVAFDGSSVALYDASGTLVSTWATFSPFVFPSFLATDASESTLVLGESSNGVVYTMPLAPSVPNPLTTLAFNYDGVFEDATHLLVSAAAKGFGLGNQIYRVDTLTGATTELVDVAGASGPIALDAGGDLYYGTSSASFPPPAGSSSVLRFAAASLTGSPVLTEADATVVAAGFDGAASLAFDPSGGGLYLAENNFGSGINRIRRVAGGPAEVLLEGVSGRSISGLEFSPSTGSATFLAYQPVTGGTLRYNTTDFGATAERNQLQPARPQVTLSGPGLSGPGPFDVSLSGAAPGGFALLYYDWNTNLPNAETVLSLQFPLFLGLGLSTLQRVPGAFPVDGSGAASRTFQNPGGLEGLYSVQFLVFDASATLVGSSELGAL